MIGRISGKLIEKQPPWICVDAQGVGYEMEVPMSTFYLLPDTGGQVVLFTHLAVREDAHLLYGFASQAERKVFRQLVKISGIGPKLALSVLSSLGLNELADAVQANSTARLVKIPGVGKKTAERLLIELRDKLDTGHALPAAKGSAGGDILEALCALGYSDKEASWAASQLDAALSVSEGIRQALKLLAKG